MENNVKLLLTMIVKDDSEADMLERCLASFMPHFDGLAVALTGVSGQWTKCKQIIQKYNGRYIQTSPQTHPKIYLPSGDSFIFGNFAEARNVSFELAGELQKTKEYDYWVWCDVDDVLISGQELKVCATLAKQQNLDQIFFTYWYAVNLDESGNIKDVMIEHLRERLLKPNMFKWISRLHEVTVPIDSNYQPKNSLYDFNPKENRALTWAHIVPQERMEANLQRNIQILQEQIKEEQGKDPRTIFYLAKTYIDLKNPELDLEAEKLIIEYLKLSGWAEERSYAWEYMGNLKGKRGDHRGALDCYHMALKEYPNRHMVFLLLAKTYFDLQLFEEANFWLDMALKMDAPRTRTTIGNPLEIKLMAASLKYNDAIRQNKIDDAIYWLKVRSQMTNEDMSGMIKTLEEAKLLNDAATWVFNFAKWLKDHNYTEKIPALLSSLPLELGRESFAHYIANEVNEPKKWTNKSIVFFASWGVEHFEGWSPKNLEKGIGGSETAVIELAKRWAKMGYDVTVFCDPREDEGEHDGVHYRPWYELNWKDEFNILVLWRSPHLLDRDIKARKIFMDLHDIASQLDWNEKRMEKINKVFFKSKFHRSMLPKLLEEKAVIISNGI